MLIGHRSEIWERWVSGRESKIAPGGKFPAAQPEMIYLINPKETRLHKQFC